MLLEAVRYVNMATNSQAFDDVRRVSDEDSRTRPHGKKVYRCEECGKQFRGLRCLKTHMRTHAGEKPYRCEECGKQFSKSGNLEKHMRTHTREKPYRCGECNKQFSLLDNPSALKRHRQTHT